MIVPFYQILVPALCMVMIINNWVRHRAGEFNMRGFIFWSLIWLGLGFFAIFPDLASAFAQASGIKDSFRALTIVAIVSLLYLSFNNLTKIDRLSRELTRVIRETALEGKDEDGKGKGKE